MHTQSTSPADEPQPPPRVAPLTAWECSVLGMVSPDNGCSEDAGTSGSSLAAADRDHQAWPFGIAAEVFLRAGATTTALVSAQQAYVVAKGCCRPCVAWTLALQAEVHGALSEELARQSRGLTGAKTVSVPTFGEEPW